MGRLVQSTLLVIVAIIITSGERALSHSPHSWAQFHWGDMRVEESSKARIQDIYKTMVGQEVAQEWGLSWAWHCSKLE